MDSSAGGSSSVVSLLLPESPALDGYLTPDAHGGGGASGPSAVAKLPPPAIPPPPAPLLDFRPASILSRLEDESSRPDDSESGLRVSLILSHALRYAIEHADNDLLLWLLALGEPWSGVLNEVAGEMQGEDGWGVIGMAIASSSGRQEKEEGVRAIVARWGLDVGIRGGRDNGGWTPLHLAALISTPPLISFLLTRGASPQAENDRGLTPLDLVSGMNTRQDATTLLQQATSTGSSRGHSNSANGSVNGNGDDRSGGVISEKRRGMLQKRRRKIAREAKEQVENERDDRIREQKEEWVKGLLKVVDVDPSLVLPQTLERSSGALEGSEDEVDEEAQGGDGVDFEVLPPTRIDDTSLVWGPSTLPHILDTFISSYRPICSPLSKRALPSNALYLYARFAHYHCDESWLDELLIGVLDRIEETVYKNVDDLAFLAFWTYNTTLLLHLIHCDEALAEAADKLLVQLEELANAIHVFIIRVAERKVDTVLDDALLEYETLEDFDDVRFEGEWTLFRSFATKKQRSSAIPKASAVFANSPSGPGPSPGGEPTSPGILETIKGKIDASPFKVPVPKSHSSLQDLRSGALDTAHSAVFGAPTPPKASPAAVTDILSAVLVILQLYDVNPVITIQAFSQVFFWIACELFNRILSRKKYLSRTKAVQIRMNVTVLEDWVRTNGLPVRTVTQHFEPVTQLLQWLQCQSALSEFGDLVGTIQKMRSINPLQMRRVVRDYRFEVNEGRMTDECAQYLAQMQKDWERQQVQTSVETIKRDTQRQHPTRSHSQSSQDDLDDPAVYSGYQLADPPTPIDQLFDGVTPLADFIPQTAPEASGEFLDSRFMLPFQLPQDSSLLIATPPPDAAYAVAFPPGTWTFDGQRSSRPPSRSSFVSSKPLSWALPDPRKIRALPPDFFEWLKEREAERRHRREGLRPPTPLQRANTNPLDPSTATPTQLSTSAVPIAKLPTVTEDETTPIGASASVPVFPSSGLATSGSIEQLRAQSRTSWNPSPPATISRDSYELSPVPTPSRGTFAIPAIPIGHNGASVRSPETTHVPLMPTSTSTESVGTGKKKWWKLGRKASQADLNESEMTGLPRKRREDSADTVRAGATPGRGI